MAGCEVAREIRRLFVFFVVAFLALVVQLTYVQVYAAPELRVHASNTRAIEAEMRAERGLILSSDGVELAGNRHEGDYYLRTYPQGALASPLLGYSSIRYGRAGVERVYNPELSGALPGLGVDSVLDWLTGRPTRGADLHLTLDSRVQRVANESLGGRRGAVVALDPQTGAVLALTSSPRYDPNNLEEEWESLQQDAGRPLVNRALNGLYPPG
jgi:peptidoglycan glycosyltransferase